MRLKEKFEKKEEEFTKGVKRGRGEGRGRRKTGSRREVCGAARGLCTRAWGNIRVCLCTLNMCEPRALCAASVLASWLNTRLGSCHAGALGS